MPKDINPAEARDTAAAARDRASRRISGVTELLASRPELRGVHAPADLLYESVSWSA